VDAERIHEHLSAGARSGGSGHGGCPCRRYREDSAVCG
jgi:hypothetical protein